MKQYSMTPQEQGSRVKTRAAIRQALDRPTFEVWFLVVLSAAAIALIVNGCAERRAGDVAVGVFTTLSCIFAVRISLRGEA